MSFTEYLENCLGRMGRGWRGKNVNIIHFLEQPFVQASTYITLGLSHHLLSLPQDRFIKFELIFTAYTNYSADYIASFMMDVCDHILLDHKAPLRGEVIGLHYPVIPCSPLNFIYVTIPTTIFDKPLDIYYEINSDIPIVLALLIPIYKEEAQFIQHYGWNKFEDIMETVELDIFDLDRPIIQMCE
jgi:hypothetical protein